MKNAVVEIFTLRLGGSSTSSAKRPEGRKLHLLFLQLSTGYPGTESRTLSCLWCRETLFLGAFSLLQCTRQRSTVKKSKRKSCHYIVPGVVLLLLVVPGYHWKDFERKSGGVVGLGRSGRSARISFVWYSGTTASRSTRIPYNYNNPE
eukprot:2683954-Rhodomonas_salina.1